MENRSSTLLDEALGLDQRTEPWPLTGKSLLIKDCVETSGSFVLHHLIKRILAPNSSNLLIFLAFSHPFSHYDRVLRKLGCNLAAQRDSSRFFFLDMLKLHSQDGNELRTLEDGFMTLFGKIQKIISALPEKFKNRTTIMIDDVPLMEVAAHGSSDHVLEFLHYCHTLTSDFGCSLVALTHMDIYSSLERPVFLLQMEYLVHFLVNAEPLATGMAADVHGQLTVVNLGKCNEKWKTKKKVSNFQFMIKENGVQYFYPGSRT